MASDNATAPFDLTDRNPKRICERCNAVMKQVVDVMQEQLRVAEVHRHGSTATGTCLRQRNEIDVALVPDSGKRAK